MQLPISFGIIFHERKSWILDGFKTWYRIQSLKSAKSPVRKFVRFSLKVNIFILFIFSPSYHIPFLFLGQLFVISAVNICLVKCIISSKRRKNMTWCPCSKSVAQYVLWFILIYESQLEQTLNREMIAQKKSRIWTCFPKEFVRTHLVSIKFLILYCKHDLYDQLQSKADRITYIKWYDLAENWIHTFISYLYNSWRRFRLFTHLTPVLCCIYCCDRRAVGISEN